MEPGGFVVVEEEVVGESVFEDIGHFGEASARSFFFFSAATDDKVEDEGEAEEEDGRGEEDEEEEAAEDDVNGCFEVGEDLVGEVLAFGSGLLTTVSSICLASCFFAFFLAFFCCCCC